MCGKKIYHNLILSENYSLILHQDNKIRTSDYQFFDKYISQYSWCVLKRLQCQEKLQQSIKSIEVE